MMKLMGYPFILSALLGMQMAFAATTLNVEFDGYITPVELSYEKGIEDDQPVVYLNIDGGTETLYEGDDFEGIYWFWKATVVQAKFEGEELSLKVLKKKKFGTQWHEPVVLNMTKGGLYHQNDYVESIYVQASVGFNGVNITEPVFNQE